MSCTARSRDSRAARGSGARTQPTRRPPQTSLLSEPTEITPGACAASGGGTSSPGNARWARTSSSTSGTPALAAALASRLPASPDSIPPVGFWHVAIT